MIKEINDKVSQLGLKLDNVTSHVTRYLFCLFFFENFMHFSRNFTGNKK